MAIAPDQIDAESAAIGRPATWRTLMDTSHVSALALKHAGIERKLLEEMRRPLPDDAVIQDLKKKKLRLKEEISRH